MNRKAFTLIELLVVVAIIGILAAVGVVAYDGYTSSAKRSATMSNCKQVSKYITNEVMLCTLNTQSSVMNGKLLIRMNYNQANGKLDRKIILNPFLHF